VVYKFLTCTDMRWGCCHSHGGLTQDRILVRTSLEYQMKKRKLLRILHSKINGPGSFQRSANMPLPLWPGYIATSFTK
jgi:hypothetical protein